MQELKTLMTDLLGKVSSADNPKDALEWARVIESLSNSSACIADLFAVRKGNVLAGQGGQLNDGVEGRVGGDGELGAGLAGQLGQLPENVEAQAVVNGEVATGTQNVTEAIQ